MRARRKGQEVMNRLSSLEFKCPTALMFAVGTMTFLVNSGCSSLEGLRSIAANRPSLLGLRDKPQPADEPGDDLYARSMNRGSKTSAPADAPPPASSTMPSGSQDAPPAGNPNDRSKISSSDQPDHVPNADQPATKQDDRSLAVATKPRTTKTLHAAAANPDDLLERAEHRVTSLSTYQVKMQRTERTRGRLQPEEEIVMSIRREPKAVRFTWENGPNQGREVIYSSAIDPRMLFVHMSNTAIPLPTMKIPVDSPMVTSNSRHSITDAGLDRVIQNLRKASAGAEADGVNDDRKALTYDGLETPPGATKPSHRFTHRTPSNETWTVYLDAKTLLPTLVFAKDVNGELIERYRYEEVRENPPELAKSDAFVPDERWGTSKGLWSRFSATAASAPSRPVPDSVAK